MTYTEFFSHKNLKEIRGALVNNFGFNKVEDIVASGCKYHHSAIRKGYHSRYYARVDSYTGKFGQGYIVVSNNPRSTYYGIRVEYYVTL